jgi:hypothetical protein
MAVLQTDNYYQFNKKSLGNSQVKNRRKTTSKIRKSTTTLLVVPADIGSLKNPDYFTVTCQDLEIKKNPVATIGTYED